MTIKNFSKWGLVILVFSMFLGMAQPAAALPPLCNLTYIPGDGGTIDGESLVILRTLEGRTGRVVQAIPNVGYRFVDWDDSLKTASRQDVCPGGRGLTFTANFTRVGTSTFFMPVGVGVGGNNRIVTMNDRGFVGVVDNLGINVFVYIWSQAEFELTPSNSNLPERHGLKVINLDMMNRVVTFEISSETQTFSLSLDEEINVDLNGDKLADLYVKFEDLVINRVELTLKTPDSTLSLIEEKTETPPIVNPEKYVFTRDLYLGMSGADVKELQQYLNNNGFSVALVGIGSLGNETSYFGSLTQKALIRYQLANGISPAIGYFGPITRTLMNK